MKRVGYLYEKMAQWENIVEAEKISTRRKARNIGVKRHAQNRWNNLVEIQQMILNGEMHTAEYKHEQRVSGQDKMRDIAKLAFHPSHIEHQLLTITADERVDRSLIRHTYASRKGYGQIACALHIKKSLAKYKCQERWIGQGDVVKYYSNIQHDYIRKDICHLIKDKKFTDAFVEPFEKFAPDGKGIPLGIRPSQITGNLELSVFDHYMTEQVKAKDYTRYLDDFAFTGATRWEVEWKFKRAKAFLEKRGLTLHEPKIHRVSDGLDMMGFVFYGDDDDMWWRKKDKKRWLRRRSRVSNPKRLRELDDAAWGMLKWGNRYCRQMWERITGRVQKKEQQKRDRLLKIKEAAMGVSFSSSGIQRTARVDKNGVPFIEGEKIGMSMILDKVIECDKWIPNIVTAQGPGRYAMHIYYMNVEYKLIVNSIDIKSFLSDMEKYHVTRLRTVFIDKGGKHYAVDLSRTEILEVDGRAVVEREGKCVYEDTKEIVKFNFNEQ